MNWGEKGGDHNFWLLQADRKDNARKVYSKLYPFIMVKQNVAIIQRHTHEYNENMCRLTYRAT